MAYCGKFASINCHSIIDSGFYLFMLHVNASFAAGNIFIIAALNFLEAAAALNLSSWELWPSQCPEAAY